MKIFGKVTVKSSKYTKVITHDYDKKTITQ